MAQCMRWLDPSRHARRRRRMYTSAIVWLYITLECAWAVEYEPLPTTAARPSLSRDTSNELIWVCPPHSDTCMGVTSPFARYIRRSIWFERKAIIITAIFLSIFIILFIGTAVFLRDLRHNGMDEEETLSEKSESEESLPWPPSAQRARLFMHLRHRSRASRHTPPRDHSDADDEDSDTASELSLSDLPCAQPPLLNAVHIAAPVRPRSPRYPSHSEAPDASDIQVVNTLPMEPAATLPPSYGTASSRTTYDKPEPICNPFEDPDTTTLSAHVATDEKATLQALHLAPSAPEVVDDIPVPSAPDAIDDIPVPSAPDMPLSSSNAQQKGKERSSAIMPAPPAPFVSSYDEYASMSKSKAQEAEEERAWLTSILPSMPGQPPDSLDLPTYQQRANELSEAPIPSAPVMDE